MTSTDPTNAREACEHLNASDPLGLYRDIDDLGDAIAVYHDWMTPGRVAGFVRVVKGFAPTWSDVACERFVMACASEGASR